MQRILYYIFIYNILFEGVLGMRKAPEVTKNASGGGAHRTRQGKSDSNPLAELAGTGQRGAGIGKSRMTSGGIRRRESRIQSGGKDTERNAPAEVAYTGQGGAKAIATRSRNSRAQDNVERE